MRVAYVKGRMAEPRILCDELCIVNHSVPPFGGSGGQSSWPALAPLISSVIFYFPAKVIFCGGGTSRKPEKRAYSTQGWSGRGGHQYPPALFAASQRCRGRCADVASAMTHLRKQAGAPARCRPTAARPLTCNSSKQGHSLLPTNPNMHPLALPGSSFHSRPSRAHQAHGRRCQIGCCCACCGPGRCVGAGAGAPGCPLPRSLVLTERARGGGHSVRKRQPYGRSARPLLPLLHELFPCRRRPH